VLSVFLATRNFVYAHPIKVSGGVAVKIPVGRGAGAQAVKYCSHAGENGRSLFVDIPSASRDAGEDPAVVQSFALQSQNASDQLRPSNWLSSPIWEIGDRDLS
jgi:hypothetical protein